MDTKLYETLIAGNAAALREFATRDLAAFLQVTTEGDNVLHVTAKYNLMVKTAAIIENPSLKSLVNQKNSKGDTPLHVAARMGSFETAEIFVNCANSGEIEAGERVTKMVNQVNDTALHDAARNGHFRIVELLIKVDCELPTLLNDAGESPLFIAVDKRHLHIALLILKDAPDFSFAGRNDMNALHAAVIRSQDEVLRLSSYMVKLKSPMTYLTNMSFKHSFKFSSFGPSAIIEAAFQNNIYRDFAKLLLEKCERALYEADEFGWTPLYYSIHFGAFGIFKVFLDKVDSSIAHKRDKRGMTITHIAAREGEDAILELLAYKFPEIWDLQDYEGQTPFHLAVERGKLACVKFILGIGLSHDGLINQQDNKGNTALHLAAIHGNNQKIFDLLIKDGRVDKTARNNEGLTVIDIILLKEYGYYEKTWVTMSLASNGGLESLEHSINKNGRKTRSSFTMPGGYKSDGGPEAGMAILSRKTAFRVFVVANALAFCFSTTSMFLHYCRSFVEKLDVHAFYTYLTTMLTSYGITAMVIAFVSGTYAALADTPGLAKAVLSIGCSFFGLQLVVYLK
ncbi:Ankyrin repeat family protein [Hibiscus syriacus]|uniref:Ankyrin repeat family protein n=1 Tax=Hibiscus syriacus TaxID=106335 RepID=A0A6A2ZAI8_HIBSY|nr:Ankyrin repeat family protein [Hibiscus syriacus]